MQIGLLQRNKQMVSWVAANSASLSPGGNAVGLASSPHEWTGSFNSSLQAEREAAMTPLYLLAMYSREKFTGGSFALRNLLVAALLWDVFCRLESQSGYFLWYLWEMPSWSLHTLMWFCKTILKWNVVFSCTLTSLENKTIFSAWNLFSYAKRGSLSYWSTSGSSSNFWPF